MGEISLFNTYLYSKTCLKRPLKKEDHNLLSRPIIALWKIKSITECCKTFIKLPFVAMTVVFVWGYFWVTVLDRYYSSFFLELESGPKWERTLLSYIPISSYECQND